MYNIVEQSKYANMSVLASGATNSSAPVKVDCAKECPCGVPTIPVPEQWLETMVTGGFKVWHIIFIIIAVVITVIVVYCCFHRCRIPRTKQEIEADLMRTNMASKFREYLQEFPNEPTTFMEALKRVQELEEKSNEQDDSGARKRMGWLKLKGKDKDKDKDKDKQEKSEAAPAESGPDNKAELEKSFKSGAGLPHTTSGEAKPATAAIATTDKDGAPAKLAAGGADKAHATANGPERNKLIQDQAEASAGELKTLDCKPTKTTTGQKSNLKPLDVKQPEAQPDWAPIRAGSKEKKLKIKSEAKLVKTKGDGAPGEEPAAQTPKSETTTKRASAEGAVVPTNATATTSRPVRARRRKDKPNLSRSKAAHLGSRSESTENNNQLSLPAPGHRHHDQDQDHEHEHDKRRHGHRHHHHESQTKPSSTYAVDTSSAVESDRQHLAATTGAPRQAHKVSASKSAKLPTGAKTRPPKDSTVVQIDLVPGEP